MDFETGDDDYPEARPAPWWLDVDVPDDEGTGWETDGWAALCDQAGREDVAREHGGRVEPVGVDEADVLECREMLAARGEHGVLSVAETLLAVQLVPTGPEAIALLASLALQTLTDAEKLAVVELWQPQLAWLTGAEQTAILDLVGPEPDPADQQAVLNDEFAPLELAAALNATRSHAEVRIRSARLLAGQLKATGDRLRAGRLDTYRVWLITSTLTSLGSDPAGVAAARQAEAQVLPGAASMTGYQLRKALKKACRQADPDWGVRMFAKARKTRRVGFDFRGDDGMVGLYAALPPVEALAMKDALERIAAQPSPAGSAGARGPTDATDQGTDSSGSADGGGGSGAGEVCPDERCHDERMADALIGMVLGFHPDDPTTPTAPKILLEVLVPLATLLGLREDTAELVGYGPIPAGMAREMAGDSAWQRWVHDDVTGHLLDRGKHTYPPGTTLAQFIEARDRTCRFPGCTHPAARCDKDHTQPFNHQSAQDCPGPDPNRADPTDLTCDPDLHPGGATSAANLAHLCRRTHRAKTTGHYQTRQDPDGTLHLTTPLGRTYTTHPHDYRPDSDRNDDHQPGEVEEKEPEEDQPDRP